MRIQVTVTAQHIKEGEPECPWKCMVALAIKEAIDSDDVSVYPDKYMSDEYVLQISPGGEKAQFLKLPASIVDHIAAFDRREKVEPFEFDLDYETETA